MAGAADDGRPGWDAMAVVGRVARPHGLRGQVVIDPSTDFVERRFRVGAVLWTRAPTDDERLTVESLRVQKGRPIVAFSGIGRIEEAERLVGRELRVPANALEALAPGSYYEHDLIGCAVVTAAGVPVGTVVKVESGPGTARLVVAGARGEMLIPLAVEICTEVDVAGRRIQVDPPQGLLEVNEVRHRHDLSADHRGGPRGRGGRTRT